MTYTYCWFWVEVKVVEYLLLTSLDSWVGHQILLRLAWHKINYCFDYTFIVQSSIILSGINPSNNIQCNQAREQNFKLALNFGGMKIAKVYLPTCTSREAVYLQVGFVKIFTTFFNILGLVKVLKLQICEYTCITSGQVTSVGWVEFLSKDYFNVPNTFGPP